MPNKAVKHTIENQFMKCSNTLLIFLPIAAAILTIGACRENQPFPDTALDARLSGGDNYTIFDASSSAFSTMLPGMSGRDQTVHGIGDTFFDSKFVSAPAPVNPGLGPIFNNTSCSGCHQRDGRGRPPLPGESLRAMLFRISIPGQAADGGPKPVPGFGTQLQDKAVAGSQPEANVAISYTDRFDTLEDGTIVSLRVPHYRITAPYKSLPPDVLISPRIASQTIGSGLIEAVPDWELLEHADPEDQDGDGISGKANMVYNYTTGTVTVGRFGWKSNVADVLGQVASAFQQDMGVTNRVFPMESSKGQAQDPGAESGVNLPDSVLHAVVFYMKTLAVPARRDVSDPMLQQGARLFESIGCAKCHIPTLTTGVNMAFPYTSNQVIHPYSDFLVHDMGPDLGDGRPDFQATGDEWRTAPLWGIGLTQKVSGYAYYLHDGRARSLTEAILWHGGEGSKSKAAFKRLSASDRDALLGFLNSL